MMNKPELSDTIEYQFPTGAGAKLQFLPPRRNIVSRRNTFSRRYSYNLKMMYICCMLGLLWLRLKLQQRGTVLVYYTILVQYDV